MIKLPLEGYKSYIAALGMFCGSIYQATINNYQEAFNLLMGAFAVFSIAHKIERKNNLKPKTKKRK